MTSSGSGSVSDELRDAMEAHALWKLRLSRALSSGKVQFDPDIVELEDRCPFGTWLCGPCIPSAMRRKPYYIEARALHAEFHECAAAVLRKIQQGDKAAAGALLSGRYEDLSATLYRILSSGALMSWAGALTLTVRKPLSAKAPAGS